MNEYEIVIHILSYLNLLNLWRYYSGRLEYNTFIQARYLDIHTYIDICTDLHSSTPS